MIKLVGRKKHRAFVMLGISDENVRLLREGKPIRVDMTKLISDLELDVVIFHGATEADMRGEVAHLIGPHTKEIFE